MAHSLPWRLDLQVKAFGKRVNDGNANPVKTAGDLVGILVEFTAGVQLHHNYLRGGKNTLFLVNIDRNTAPVIPHGDRSIGIDDDVNAVAMAGKAFVDGVVDDFIDHMVKTRTVIGVADIHTGTLANGIKPLQNADGFCAIFGLFYTFGFHFWPLHSSKNTL